MSQRKKNIKGSIWVQWGEIITYSFIYSIKRRKYSMLIGWGTVKEYSHAFKDYTVLYSERVDNLFRYWRHN